MRCTSLPAALVLIGSVVAVLPGCGPAMEKNPVLEQARSAFRSAQNDPEVMKNAPLELKRAQADLLQAEDLWKARAPAAEMEHYAYLAQQRTAIARETASLKSAEKAVEDVSAERNRVLLESRTREAELARQQAEAQKQQAAQARQQAEESRKMMEAKQKEAELARQQAEAKAAEADMARQEAAAAAEQARQLEAQLQELHAVKSERGMVITLGDVLFDTNKAELRTGALQTLGKLAAFLGKYPERRVLIEGFTDSRGSETYNLGLSERRAAAVRDALVVRGVEPARVETRGYGESYPVATNETAAGQQMNRRVEIVISDEQGQITARQP